MTFDAIRNAALDEAYQAAAFEGASPDVLKRIASLRTASPFAILDAEIEDAKQTASESASHPNSYGHGFNSGYHDGLAKAVSILRPGDRRAADVLEVAYPGWHIYDATLKRQTVIAERSERPDAKAGYRRPENKAWAERCSSGRLIDTDGE